MQKALKVEMKKKVEEEKARKKAEAQALKAAKK